MAIFTRLTVAPDGGDEYTLDVDMRAVMAWETKFPGRSLADIGTSMSAHQMYELAWITARRANKPVPDSFKDFVDRNEVVSAVATDAIAAAKAAANQADVTDDASEPASVAGEAVPDENTEGPEVPSETDPTQPTPSTGP